MQRRRLNFIQKGDKHMGRSKLEKEVAEIIGLPNDEFTFMNEEKVKILLCSFIINISMNG
jgi:hypothetical protein